MLRIRLALVALVAFSSWGMSSCLGWTERLCSGDETYIEFEEGGATCEPRLESDPECPDGERARRLEPSGRTDCVPDEG